MEELASGSDGVASVSVVSGLGSTSRATFFLLFGVSDEVKVFNSEIVWGTRLLDTALRRLLRRMGAGEG